MSPLRTALPVVFALLPVVTAHAAGQVVPADTLRAALTIFADAESALVIVGGTPAGRSPVHLPSLPPGTYEVSAFSPDPVLWDAAAAHALGKLAPGGSDTLRLRLTRPLRVLTDPSGATVHRGDSLLGTTPLVLREPARSLREELIISREGFVTVRAPAGRFAGAPLLLPLVPDSLAVTGRADPVALLAPPAEPPLHLYMTGGMMVAAGAVTAVAKIAADNAYEEYLLTGDRSRLSRTRSLDRVAAVSLIVTQISFGLFAYFLFSE